MIIKKSPKDIAMLRKANRHVARLLNELLDMARPGMTTLDLDAHAEGYIRRLGAIPTFKDQAGFPNCICTSVNEVVVHGIPSAKPLAPGDIISIDVGMQLDGWCGDCCATTVVGPSTPDLDRLISVTRTALDVGIEQARPGKRLGAIGHAIQSFVEANGFGVVRAFCGHGIGREMHEEPEVKHFGPRKSGPVLEAGMVLCIEPMVTAGTWRLELLSDGWSARTVDLKPSAQFEHTVAITPNGPEILSLPD